ncbi:MAG: MmgE/PrpD family protein, partial [Pseudomonadota bacterium]
LDAIVVGYQATIALGRAVGPGHYSMWHNTGTCGAIGAAAATSHLINLTTEECAHALALAMSQSAGLWQTRHEPESMGKQLHTAVAARAGLHAAYLAKKGMRGPLSILEGEQGFFAAMCPGADPKSVLNDHQSWFIHDVSFKPWPACRHAHAAIDAALMARQGEDWRQSETIIVETYADSLKFCDCISPQSVIEAKFSLQHSVAVTLLYGEPELVHFEPPYIHHEDVDALRQKISVRVGDVYEDSYPSRFGAELRIGDFRYEVPDALGDPENPLSVTQMDTKLHMLFTAGGVSPASAEDIIFLCRGLPQTGQLDDLHTQLRKVLP